MGPIRVGGQCMTKPKIRPVKTEKIGKDRYYSSGGSHKGPRGGIHSGQKRYCQKCRYAAGKYQ